MHNASILNIHNAGLWPGKGVLNSGTRMDGVDQEIAHVIRSFSELGLATVTASSAGHYRDGIFVPPYIALHGDLKTLRMLFSRLHAAYQGHQLALPWNMAGGFDRWNDLVFNLHVDVASPKWPRAIGLPWIDARRWRHVRKQIDIDLQAIVTTATQAAREAEPVVP